MLRTALVTGGNRGIGLEVCRELAQAGIRVVLTARDKELGRRAIADLGQAGLEVRLEQLDLASDRSVLACAGRLAEAGIHIDILINNGAIYPAGDALAVADSTLREAVEINFVGAWRTCRAFVPAMMRAGYGRVVNVSSGYGSFNEGLEGPAAYSVTKAALNALTLKLAHAVDGRRIKVNAVCPGWVRTRMGGTGARLSVEQGADTVVWLATLPGNGPTGKFFRQRRRIGW
jgi:NAD(P)-dependent dehydrogenase (short-subunit alcohol dehydrogenase family)